tara:strand:- start:324 stop:491 length:168 start_codon:yes stop_codon:yes gene_type:complete
MKTTKQKSLSKRQKQALDRHSVHHTPKHMAEMKRRMRGGSTFTRAHTAAMQKVGK